MSYYIFVMLRLERLGGFILEGMAVFERGVVVSAIFLIAEARP
jgi:hypothetical protein